MKYQQSINAVTRKDKMPAVAKIFLPEIRRSTDRLHRRRVLPNFLREWTDGLRQLAWSEKLFARFANSTSAAFSDNHTLLRNARFWMLQSHVFAPAFHVNASSSLALRNYQRERLFVAQSTQLTIFQRTTLTYPLVTQNYFRQYATAPGVTLTQNSLHASQTTLHRSALTLAAAASSAVQSMQLIAASAATEPGRHRVVDSTALLLAQHLVSKVCRVEEQLGLTRTVLLRRSLPIAEQQLVETATPSQMHAQRPRALSTAEAVPPQPFSIQRITDEVVRQLDNRLIAARERFGKV